MNLPKKKLFTIVLYATLLLYFLFQGGRTSLMLFVLFNLLLIYLFLGRYSGIRNVSGQRRIQQTQGQGVETIVHIQAKIPGLFPIPFLIVKDSLYRHTGEKIEFEGTMAIGLNRKGEWSYTIPKLQRGIYKFGKTECTTYDAFGLMSYTGSYYEAGALQIMPQTIPLANWYGIEKGNRGQYSFTSSIRSFKESTQLSGIREYLHGDRLSRIHWNATAKSGQWKSKEFEREALPRTVMILDRNVKAYHDNQGDLFELAVSIAASFAEYGLRRDVSLGLMSIGKSMSWFNPQTGIKQHSDIMNHLTSVDKDCDGSLAQVLPPATSFIVQNSVLLLITSDHSDSLLTLMIQLKQKGFVPILIYIKHKADSNVSMTSIHRIRKQGFTVIEVDDLENLPKAVEGSGRR